jgi:hypothetical protein
MSKVIFAILLNLLILPFLAIPAQAQTVCHGLPPVPFNLVSQNTVGSDTDQFNVTIAWNGLSDSDFQRYENTDVYITAHENNDITKEVRYSTNNFVDRAYGRTKTVKNYTLTNFAVEDGRHQLSIHLTNSIGDIYDCTYENRNLILTIMSRAEQSPAPGEGKKVGDICDPERQTGQEPKQVCPTGSKCQKVSASNEYRCSAIVNAFQGCSDADIKNGKCTGASGKQCGDGTGVSTAIGCVPTDPTSLIKTILKLATGVAGGIAFLLMIFGAFQMITSSGNPEALKAGQDRFSSAIIGLLFIIFSVLILKIIGVDILGLGKAFGI